jgi:hypothetical protein
LPLVAGKDAARGRFSIAHMREDRRDVRVMLSGKSAGRSIYGAGEGLIGWP